MHHHAGSNHSYHSSSRERNELRVDPIATPTLVQLMIVMHSLLFACSLYRLNDVTDLLHFSMLSGRPMQLFIQLDREVCGSSPFILGAFTT